MVGLTIAASSVWAQGIVERDTDHEIEDLKNSQREILRQLSELSAALGRTPKARKPEIAQIDLTGAFIFGNPAAPFCQRHFAETFPALKQDYVNSGKARYALLELPNDRIHPMALLAAEAAPCAGEQHSFMAMHENLLGRPIRDMDDIVRAAENAGVMFTSFDDCLVSGKWKIEVLQRRDRLRSEGVNAIPFFFIGSTFPRDNILRVQRVVEGAAPLGSFRLAIDAVIASEAKNVQTQ